MPGPIVSTSEWRLFWMLITVLISHYLCGCVLCLQGEMGKSGERGREGEPGIKVPMWLHFLFCPDVTVTVFSPNV